MALAFAVPDKGLSNSAGSNNCFLNVVIQSLWHLGSFRQRFFQWSEQHHTHQAPHSCVFCALSVVFTQYAFCEESSIPPDALRVALDLIYKGDRRFQVGELDDAAEALDAILTCLENGMEKTKKALVAKGAESVRLPHSAFGLTITEQLRCKSCRAAAEPMTSSSFIFYTYSSALARMHQTYPHLSFGQLLFAISDEDFKSCPASETGGCPAKGSVYRHLMSQPDIFTVDIVWESPNPEYADIARTIELVPTELDLNHVFPSVRRKTPYFLRGMICYYGKHYNAYFYSYSKRQWLVYDDSRVIPVAHTWAEIQERCRRGRFQPSVLFYETQGIQKLDAPDLWKVTTTTAAPVADDSGDLPPPYVDAPPSYADVVTDDLPPSYAAATTSSSLPSSTSPSSSSLSTSTPSSSSSSSSSSSQPSIPSTVTPTSPVHYHPRVGTSSPFAQRDRAVFSAFRRMPPGTVAMVPVTSLPPGAIPVSALPPGAIPVSALPPGAVPVSAIPVSSLRPGAGPTPMAAMPYPQPSAPPMMSPAARMRTATPPLPSAPPSSPTPSAPPAFSAPLPVPAVVPIFASAPPAARQPAAPLPAEPALVFSPVPSAPMADEEFDRILSPARDPKWSSLERRVESNPWYSSGQVAPAACPRTAPDSLYKSSVLAKASEETSFLPRGSYSQLPLLF